MTQRLLNLGCGFHIHADWINVDFTTTLPGVMSHDLRKGIPFESGTFDVVYHSNILEHFGRNDAIRLIQECFRVLKPDGILRVAVPDLEQIVRQYLSCLEEVRRSNNPLNAANYDWAIIEMLDQMVRDQSGGEMFKYWQMPVKLNEELLESRIGYEYLNWKQRTKEQTINEDVVTMAKKLSLLKKIEIGCRIYYRRLFKSRKPKAFRETGEIHKWMYDNYSLSKILMEAGFRAVQQKDAFSSDMTQWEKYCELDVIDGKARKPDSIFFEAKK